MTQRQETTIAHYWRNRKRKKSYQLLKSIVACYVIIFAVLLLKTLSRGISIEEIARFLSYTDDPVNSISLGWVSSILLQSATVVAVFINSLLGRELLEIGPSVYLMIGLILGNSATPLFAALFVKSKKHWDLRHGFEIGFANIVYSLLVATVVLGLQITTGLYSTVGLYLKGALWEVTTIEYVPSLLDLVVLPVFALLHTEEWPILIAAAVAFLSLIWAFSLLADSVIRYHGGLKKSQKKIEERLGSKWQTFSIGLILTCLIPSSSLLATLLVPLAAKGVLNLRQAIPFLIATNLATFIDVVIVAFADGSVGAITGALILIQMSLVGIIFMNQRFGIGVIHRITRFFTLRFLPQNRGAIVLLLMIYTLVPILLSLL